MIHLERLRIFHIVAQHKSLTSAADYLGMTQPAVSRHMSILERQLNTSLFHRHPRGLILTEEGDILLSAAQRVLSKLILSEAIMSEDNKPQGHLKIACPHDFGSFWLIPKIPEFSQINPHIHLSLTLNPENSHTDLSMLDVDVIIGTQAPDDLSLTGLPFMSTQAKIYGATTYFSDHPIPSSFQDLDQHPLITLSHDPSLPDNWLLMAGRDTPRKPYLALNNSLGILKALASGMGIGSFHFLDEHSKPDLLEVLAEEKPHIPTITHFMIYHSHMQNSKRVQALQDFLFKKSAGS